MRLPPRKNPGDPVLAKDWNLLLEAIARRSPQPGEGLQLISSSGGFAYSLPPGLIVPRQVLPPFAAIGIHRAGTAWDVIIKEGWVIERKPKARAENEEEVVKFHMPEYEGTPLDNIPRPRIGMSFGDFLYCKFKTDMQGELTETPEMIVDDEEKYGTHYQPLDPEESGVEGDYWVKILQLINDGGVPKAKVYQQSDIEHWAVLWTGINLGGGARVYKKHEDPINVFMFRSLVGHDPEEKTLAELLGDGSNLFEFIELEVDTEVVEQAGEILIKGKVKVPVPAGVREYFKWKNKSVTNELDTVRHLVESPGFIHDSCDCETETPAPPPPP